MIKKYFCRGENIKITNKLLILLIVLIACIGAVSASDDISDVSDNSTAVSLSYDEQNVDYSISNVDSSGDIAVANDWSGLAECISNEDSKIKLSGNTFSATSQITINYDLIISGSSNTIITSSNSNLIPFVINNPSISVHFINLTFKDSVCKMMIQSVSNQFILENCVFDNITATGGHCSVVYNNQGLMNINNCNFTNCKTSYGTITNYNSANVNSVKMNVDNCNFINNSATVEPGAINNCGLLNVTASSFINNSAVWWAGAIHTHSNAKTKIVKSLFEGNVAGWNGGALYTYSLLEVYDSTFINNNCTTNNGGGAIGAYNFGSQYNITIGNCTFKYNNNLCNALDNASTTSLGRGGAISVLNGGYLNVHNSTFVQNFARIGQAICAYNTNYDNSTGGTPYLKIYNNKFINHTGDSDTVYLTNGTYIFENNTFENSKQTNIGTNNIIIPTTSVNSIMSISLEEEDIIIQQVDDELKHVVYINGNINSATDCDGLSYETGFGYNGVNSINRFFANQTFTNGKDFSFSNITVYLADYTGGYYIQYTTGMGVATFIGQNRNNVTISNLNFAGYYGAEGFNMTFINLTIRLPDSKPSTVKIDIEGNFKFINCTFIYNKNVNAMVSNVININSNIAAEYYDNNEQIQDNIYTPEYHPSLSGFGHFVTDFYNCDFVNYTATNVINSAYLTTLNVVDCTFENCNVTNLVHMEMKLYDGEEEINVVNPTIINCEYTNIANASVAGLDNDFFDDIVHVRFTPTVNVEVEPATVGEGFKVIVTVPSDATGKVNITVDGNNYTSEVVDGKATFNITGLKKGNYTVEAVYFNDEHYDNATKNSTFEINYSNVVTNSTFNYYFMNGFLNDDYNYTNLTFKGSFSNLNTTTITINKSLSLTGDEAVMDNIGFNLAANNITLDNFALNINNIETAIMVAGNNITLTNNNITYTSSKDRNGYGIYAEDADNLTIANNNIEYTGATNGTTMDAIVSIVDCNNVKFIDNSIDAVLNSVPVSYDASYQATVMSQGVTITGSNSTIENNKAKIKYGDYYGEYDTLYAFSINGDNTRFKNNEIAIDGHEYVYGVNIGGNNIVADNNNITVNSDSNYVCAIQLNGPSTGSVSNNNITVTSPGVAYGIYSSGWSGVINANYTDNTVKADSNVVYAFELMGTNENVENNTIVASGNYTTGIATNSKNITIENNNITTSGKEKANSNITGDTFGAMTVGINVKNSNNATIKNNNITTTGDYAVKITVLNNGLVSDNYLIADSRKGDESVSGNAVVENNIPSKIVVNIEASDLTKYYKNASQYVIKLVDGEGNPLANTIVTFNIIGKSYTVTTDEDGIATLTINLNPGVYTVSVLFAGNDTHRSAEINSTVKVLSTVEGNDIVKYYKNATQYSATFLDSQGNPLANQNVTFNIIGKIYSIETDDNGTAVLPINLIPGTYTITATNPVDGLMYSNNITVLSSITGNDIIKFYRNTTQYSATFLDSQGNPLANKNVTFNIIGKLYSIKTDDNGVATLPINLNPGEYIITVTNPVDGLMYSNSITVLPTLICQDLTKKYGSSATYDVQVVDDTGKPCADVKVEFNIIGKIYNLKTDSQGIAKLPIRLIPGEYIVTAKDPNNGLYVSKTITVTA